MADAHETDKNIEIWKIKKLIKALEAARGNGTSMISLVMPPRDQISRVTKMLGDEFGTASNIKSRVNRQSVLGAITSAQQRLKLYNKVPPNGLVLYTGTIVTEDGKDKKVTIDFEPFRPINASLYLCDNKFHTEDMNELPIRDTGKYVFGVDDTLKALEMGAVEILIMWENLDINRYVQEKMSLLEWFANEYKRFGCALEFVTNKSQEGSQFCRGFGGIGGILRYQLDMRLFDEVSDDGENYEDSD
ncbi:unnamed protein product, partial [Vitis vinifera]